MSEDMMDAPPNKGGKIIKTIVIALVVLIMSGAGIAGGLYAAGAFGQAGESIEEDPAKPRLVLKGEDPVAIAEQFAASSAGDHASGSAAPAKGHSAKLPQGGVDLPTPRNISKYQATYFQVSAPYTSNLADTDSLMQISLAVSTYYDARVIDAIKTHELAMRSAILMLLAQELEMEISTPEGKVALQSKLTRLVNRILKEKTGYSGVDNVYFTNFVIQ